MIHQPDTFPPCYIEIGNNRCTGCAACSNGCLQYAIKMVLTDEGFYRPFLQKDKCNECLLCQRVCPISSIQKISCNREYGVPEVLAAWSTDDDTHFKSSSGGIFSELAYHVIERKGVVCGCKWSDDWTPIHVMVKNRTELEALRGSKYVPSRIDNDFYRKILSLTKVGVPVLFCGTPCQTAGLKSIIPQRPKKNLILVDLVCHGVPSLSSFWRYLDWKFGGREAVDYFSFRNKEITAQTICAIDKSGKKYLKSCGDNSWFRSAMVYHLFLQESCYSCPFGNIPRTGDISLGDFWGIPKGWSSPLGDSAIFINSAKGKDLVQALINGNKIKAKESDYSTISKHIGRVRGVIYRKPIARLFSLNLIKMKRYEIFFLFIYLPLKVTEWFARAIKRRIVWLVNLRHRFYF